ncbi:P-loop ATPase, Sll1717 family [Roseibium sp. M-1]
MTSKENSFVAYSSRDPENADLILEGVKRANSVDACEYHFEPWAFNDITGKPLISPVLENIEKAPFIVADITFLNLNVVYEIGFAIGARKRVVLIRNAEIDGDFELSKRVGIFDTLGFSSYHSSEDIRNKLTSFIEKQPLPINDTLDRRSPVYILPSSKNTTASTSLIARIKRARYRFRSFVSSEDIRLSATDAISQVAKSAGVAALLDNNNNEQDIRAMFVAGLADGMQKPLLFLCPYSELAPLDVRDEVKLYKTEADIAEFVADFCPEINAKMQEGISSNVVAQNLLASVSVGDSTAENEMTTLEKYYLQTDQFLRSSRGEVNLVVGRKGSGKTALFIRLRDTIRSDKRNIVVDLKPESYELLKLKDEILDKLAEGSKQHLITAFWEYLILLEVSYKILEKDNKTHRNNHLTRGLYEDLNEVYHEDQDIADGDFSERVMQLSNRVLARSHDKLRGKGETAKLSNADITEIVYSHDIRKLKDLLQDYLDHKQSVLILFDNLDKSWSTVGVDKADATTLRCLIDAGRKVERDMQRRGHAFRCIIFVRNDVYEHLMQNSPDYGKEMRVTLDWSDHDLLREMLRLRLLSEIDQVPEDAKFSEIWSLISASHVFGEESSNFIIDRSLMRPRNVLKFFNHARGFAVNLRKEKIDQDDYLKGLKAYSQDLLIELDRELSDVYPVAKDLLYHFIDCKSEISAEDLTDIMCSADIPREKQDNIRDFLLYHGVLGLNTIDGGQYIFDVGYDLKQLVYRMKRMGTELSFVMNPAFGPALEIKDRLFEGQKSLVF